MSTDDPEVRTYLIAALCGAVLALILLGSCFQQKDPNEELVRATREAIHMAEEARQDAADARRTALALRVVALAAGVTAPLIVAYLIYRLEAQRAPTCDEVLEALDETRLPDPCVRELPERRQLEVRPGEEQRRRP